MSAIPIRRHAAWIFLAYLLFVVYGSLIPFEYRDHALNQALEEFANIAYLDLGVGSRADWIANILLYIPLAFFGCVWLLGMRLEQPIQYLVLIPVLLICLSVAVAVEFTQIFFAPRTVSINDLIAETLGTFGGILLWAVARWRMLLMWSAFREGGRRSLLAVIAAYILGYVALSLFPFDFVISLQELSWRLQSDTIGWLIAANCSDWIRCLARLVGDAAAITPLGLFLLLAAPMVRLKRLFVAGLLLGLLLEGIQILLASGTSQGLSALMRGVGLVAGAAIGSGLYRTGAQPLARLIWRATPLLIIPYLLLLALLAGWLADPWITVDHATARLAEVSLLPFYYHYFSSEPVAMASLLANAAMYAPIGAAYWAKSAAGVTPGKTRASGAAFWALLIALPIELGKLLAPPKHPDFTNLLIAAVTAAFIFAVVRWIERLMDGKAVENIDISIGTTPSHLTKRSAVPTIDWPATRPSRVLLGLPALLAVAIGLFNYPVGTTALALLLLLYGVLLWQRPLLWFFLIPALLPVLDLSHITGRLLLDEFDLFVLITFAVGYPRYSAYTPRPWPNRLLPAAIILLWISWILAMTKGLWPLVDLTGDIVTSSHSPLETWQVGKGMFWALLLIPMIRRLPVDKTDYALNSLLSGLVAGLGVLTLVVLWKRHVYVGLADFQSVYRVIGTFSSMATGGAYIEAFIAFTFPVLAVWILNRREWTLKLFGIVFAILATYSMLVTFSRGGYAGLVAGLLVVALGVLRIGSGHSSTRWLTLGGLILAVIAVALPILSGEFAQQRLSRTADDFAFRLSHWSRALNLMDSGIVSQLTGAGFGSYPIHYLLNANSRKPPGSYSILSEGNNPYLRLGAGEAVYLDQIVDVRPGMDYRLSIRVRDLQGDGVLRIPLCEKALLYSFECIWNQFEPEKAIGDWHKLTIEGNLGNLGGGGHWPYRTVKLSLYNAGSGTIDVDDISLVADKQELIVNGDFSDGAARWLFVTDQDLAWHIHQQWVETYFAQGVLGVLGVLMLLLAVARVLVPQLLKGNLPATAATAALAGFLTVGLLGSTMDTARLSMLFYLGAFYAGLLIRVPLKNPQGLADFPPSGTKSTIL